jgi:glucan phosphoethanolaminetransferase (alkaline phosphatase superfamily)
MIDAILRDLRQPEYIHVLINPLPVYGLAMGLLGLIVAFFLKSRRAQIVTLIIVLIAAASAWPTFIYGKQAKDPVLSMENEVGQAWLEEHEDRAEDLIWFYYGLAVLSAVALVAPRKWPRSATPLCLAVILLGAVTLGSGSYIAYAGGKIRHREFRNVLPPPRKSEAEH